MISVEGLKVEFAAKPLFHDVSFVVNDKDRIALVGKNGAGKSTLLRIISGMESPSSGSVAISQGTSVGYLPQVMKLSDETTLRQEAMKAFSGITSLRERLDRLEREIASRADYESQSYMSLLAEYTSVHERYMLIGAANHEAELEKTLLGLGFRREDFERPTSEFSGGWRMRIEIAKLLMRRPDVLLLDEPTNHLDIDSIQWLEQFIASSAKAVIIVSHDRAFINNVTDRTIELSCGTLTDYKVKYDEYVRLRKERRSQQIRAWENQQKEIADIKDFIERFRYKPTKAVQVQSRIKQLEKIVPIEIDEVDNSTLRLRFPPTQRSGDYPVICEEVAKSYGEHNVFSGVNLTIKRGEKVAFVGRNGEGKSTLVKCIMGEIPFDGMLKVGHNVKIGYFAQNQAQLLDGNLTVFQTIDYVATGDIRLKIRDILGAFMFGGEASDKKVSVLSGGERSRLAMIRLLLEPVNMLILDEPTNHLDIPSKEVLKEAIKAFDGTAIIVSHDREFLDGLVSKVYEFGQGKVREHLGGIYDFLSQRGIENLSLLGSDPEKQEEKTSDPTPNSSANTYRQHKEEQKKKRKAEKALKECEQRIADLEAKLKQLDATLCDPKNAADLGLVNDYTSAKYALDKEMAEWERLASQMEEMD